MTGARITKSDKAILRALDRIIAATDDMAPPLKNVGEALQQSTIERIIQGVTPTGEPFEELDPSYAAVEKQGPGILRERGNLLKSIAYQLGGDGKSVEIGTDIVYGAIHQFGGEILPKNGPALVFMLGGKKVAVASVEIPARPYLGLSADDRTRVLAIFSDFFVKAPGRAATG